jgi:hypothetical protein
VGVTVAAGVAWPSFGVWSGISGAPFLSHAGRARRVQAARAAALMGCLRAGDGTQSRQQSNLEIRERTQ